MQIHFAPMQGQTDAVYRRTHAALAGGVDCYYTPFIRIEKGQVRTRDLRDIEADAHVVPQIIARMQSFWQPLENTIPRKQWKQLVKTGSLKNYESLLWP